MELILTLIIGLIVATLYLAIEFAIPIFTIAFIYLDKGPIWLWATILIIWFVARMIIYVKQKGEK